MTIAALPLFAINIVAQMNRLFNNERDNIRATNDTGQAGL